MRNMAKTAYARTLEAVGAEAFDASFARFLSERPPASGLIREVIAAYGTFAVVDDALLSEAAPYTTDLLGFERAKWEIGWLPVTVTEAGRTDPLLDGLGEL